MIKMDSKPEKISIIGLGYVGLPLALALSRHYSVVGFDLDEGRVAELQNGYDRTGEVERSSLGETALVLSTCLEDLSDVDVFIVAVPTPVDGNNNPDLGALKSAAESVGKIMRHGAIVVFESTVYPGVTEDICGPVLEEASQLRCGIDFFLGYSPERINPGDSVHTVERIVKVVAGQTPEVAEQLSQIYGSVNGGQIFIAKDIRTAEAAKVIENAQRDINIAFMNEIAQIFGSLNISIYDVLEAANTKWNFLPFTPGLVGGHCIGVDPYYLAHSAKMAGLDPTVILSGREINDGMAGYIAKQISARLNEPAKVLVLGLTFKENVPDLRNSKVADLVKVLSRAGHSVTVHDPLADPNEARALYGIEIAQGLGAEFDCVVGCVAHREYANIEFRGMLRDGGLICDLKGIWRNSPALTGYRYWTL